MVQDSELNQGNVLSSLSIRFPEKTFYLGQVFQDTTNSYKLVWFLAILSLLKRSEERAFRIIDIFTEMAVIAWHPVCLYRLSLGRQDKLQNGIMEIKTQFQLPADAEPVAVRKFVETNSQISDRLAFLRIYVPTRFLTPWFADKLKGVRSDLQRTRDIERLAKESQGTPFATPYYLEGTRTSPVVKLNESWRAFFIDNLGIVQAFAEYHLALYLQARNPNVPGVVNKLRAPTTRQLRAAREFWRLARRDFEQSGRSDIFRDIYSQNSLSENFAIDHFLPWSFVVHDLLWNLAPVEPTTNSKKSDCLPDLDKYLPALAEMHFRAMEVSLKRPRLLEDYIDCFKQEPEKLLALGQDGFMAKYREVMLPQARIAMNQGFQSGWVLRN